MWQGARKAHSFRAATVRERLIFLQVDTAHQLRRLDHQRLFVPEGRPKIAQSRRAGAGLRIRDVRSVPSGRLRCTCSLAFEGFASVVPHQSWLEARIVAGEPTGPGLVRDSMLLRTPETPALKKISRERIKSQLFEQSIARDG